MKLKLLLLCQPGWRGNWGIAGQADALEDLADGPRLGDEGDDLHALRTTLVLRRHEIDS